MTSHTSITQIGETGLIERIKAIVPARIDDSDLAERLVRGIGDDTAVYRPAPGRLGLLTTDAFIEGVHFDLTFTSFQHLGWKAMTANLSDIAAMGGRPGYALVVLSLPRKISIEMVEEFYRGAAAACKKYSCLIAGGDTVASAGNMSIAVTMTGDVEETAIVYRNGAKPGDLICVSGHIGASHAGLKVLQREKQRFLSAADRDAFRPNLEPYTIAIEKHLAPKPRLDLAPLLAGPIRASAMIDISDGLASEIHRICDASGTGAAIYEHNLPVESITQIIATEFSESAPQYALYGGEEYELLFTMSDEMFERLERKTSDVTIIGRITKKEDGVTLVRENGESEALPFGGWDHFAPEP